MCGSCARSRSRPGCRRCCGLQVVIQEGVDVSVGHTTCPRCNGNQWRGPPVSLDKHSGARRSLP
eukprot:6716443-Heterocapsa_arctica.AAC.1